MFIGIDLGTSNSTLAVFDGEAVTVVPNSLGETLTPSVVRVDGRGNVSVGRKAQRFLETDPASVCAEFKRLMGTAEARAWGGAGKPMLPEELSAQVLSSLLGDARDSLGFPPRAAVISTPALFELPQNHATVKAGQLAGLQEVVLIQEPIAAAIAAGWRQEGEGTWLVFDLGGGTLDVSLLETKDGRLRVVDHAGDNFLGGKDLDHAVVDWALQEIHRGFSVPDLRRDNPKSAGCFAKLKAACEQARVELSRATRAALVLPALCEDANGNPVDLDLVLTRTELESCIDPLLARAEYLVRGLLAQNQRGPGDVVRIVFVGGPTCTPALRTRIGGIFGGRIAEGIDPMTIVARGAALFAATTGLAAHPVMRATTAKAGLAMRIEHPPVTADVEPFVVGRFLLTGGETPPHHVRIERSEPSEPSDYAGDKSQQELAISAEGSFVAQVSLVRHRRNRFRVLAFDAEGQGVQLATSEFTVVHGVSVADPPLARTVGVACSDDSTQIYFRKGTPLPARKMFVHQTIKTVAAASQDDALRIPVVQGESFRAHRNRLIGTLEIRGVNQDLPAGSRVEVTLHLDRSGQLHTRADVPAIGQTFEDVVHVLVPTASLATLVTQLAAIERRIEAVRMRAFQSGVAAAVQALDNVPSLLDDAERTLDIAKGGDRDAGQRVERLLTEVDSALDDAEAVLAWPDLDAEAQRCSLLYAGLVSQWGTQAEQSLFDQALQAATQARAVRNAGDLERHLQAMHALGKASYCRNPQSMSNELDWLSAHVVEALNVTQANQLIEHARAALQRSDGFGMRGLLAQLWALFPSSVEQQAKSFGSGIR
jgi:molecular chaperone DnaK